MIAKSISRVFPKNISLSQHFNQSLTALMWFASFLRTAINMKKTKTIEFIYEINTENRDFVYHMSIAPPCLVS